MRVGIVTATALATLMLWPVGTNANPGKGQSSNAPGQIKKAEQPALPASPGKSDHSHGTAGTIGNPAEPQPPSTANQNPGGANNGGDCRPYCSTRDGSPSLNGNGVGQAKGKPCAGCVGKADNKTPPGQQPSGADNNHGYECDGNAGVGVGNPAHTSCSAGVTPPPPVAPPPVAPPPPEPISPPPPPATMASSGEEPQSDGPVVVLITPQEPTATPRPIERQMSTTSLRQPGRVMAPATTPSTPTLATGELPFTGSNNGLLGLAGLLLVAAGVLLRRRTSLP